MFEATLQKASTLKKVIEAIKDLVTDGNNVAYPGAHPALKRGFVIRNIHNILRWIKNNLSKNVVAFLVLGIWWWYVGEGHRRVLVTVVLFAIAFSIS